MNHLLGCSLLYFLFPAPERPASVEGGATPEDGVAPKDGATPEDDDLLLSLCFLISGLVFA